MLDANIRGSWGRGIQEISVLPLQLCSHFTAVSGRARPQTQVGLTPKSMCLTSTERLGTPLGPRRRGSWQGTRPNTAGGEQVEREKVSESQHLPGSGETFPIWVDPDSRCVW